MANGLPPEFDLPVSRRMSPSTVEGLFSGLGMGAFNLLGQPSAFGGPKGKPTGVGPEDLEYQEERRRQLEEQARRDRGEQLPPAEVGPRPDTVDTPTSTPTDSPVHARGRARQGALDVLSKFGKDGPFTELMNHFKFAVDEAGLPTGSYEDMSFKIYNKLNPDRSDPTKVTVGDLGDKDFTLLRNLLVTKAQSEMHTDPDFEPEFPGDYGWYRSNAPSPSDRAGHAWGPMFGESQENVAAAQELSDYIMGSFQPEEGPLGLPLGVGGTRQLNKWGRSASEVEEEVRRLMEGVRGTTGQAEREGRSPFISGPSEDIYGRQRRPSRFIPNFP